MANDLKFIRQEDGDYIAKIGHWRFTIWKSTDAGFGISNHWLGPDEDRPPVDPYFHSVRRIVWLRSKRRCEEYAAKFLSQWEAAQ